MKLRDASGSVTAVLSSQSQPQQAPPRGPSPRRFGVSRFALEIILIVSLKALVLYGLYLAFFNHPAAKHMFVDPAQVTRQMLAPAPSAGEPTQSPAVPEASAVSKEDPHAHQ